MISLSAVLPSSRYLHIIRDMVPRPLLTLMALFAFIGAINAAPTPASSRTGNSGNYDRPQAPAIVQKTIAVEVLTPDGAWELKIEEVRQVRSELWVFAKVERPEGAMGAMMVSAAADQISGRFPDLKIKTFVVGKTWTWTNEEPVEWLSSAAASDKRRQGQRIWRR